MDKKIVLNFFVIGSIIFSILSLTFLTVLTVAQPIPPPSGIVGWWPGDGDASDIIDGNDGSS